MPAQKHLQCIVCIHGTGSSYKSSLAKFEHILVGLITGRSTDHFTNVELVYVILHFKINFDP